MPVCRGRRSNGAHLTCRFRRTLLPLRYLIDPCRCSICDYGVTDHDDEVVQRDLRRARALRGGETLARLPSVFQWIIFAFFAHSFRSRAEVNCSMHFSRLGSPLRARSFTAPDFEKSFWLCGYSSSVRFNLRCDRAVHKNQGFG